MAHPRSTPFIDALNTQDSFEEVYRTPYRGVEYVVGSAVPGHVAEFGTSSGRTAMVLGIGLADFTHKYVESERRHGISQRKLLLLDSFEGFPPAMHPIDEAAPHIASGIWGPGVMKDATPEVLMDMCGSVLDRERVEIHAGWYSETIPRLERGLKLALVHIDCDFYASTLEVLDRLFAIDAFADGCALYFDDWYCNRGSPEFGEHRAWAECVAKHQPRFTDVGSYGVVGKRFIIHER